MPTTLLHYDAFSTRPHGGNPAGVVLDAGTLADAQMQEIAKKVGFNETALVGHSAIADYKIRYFTPGHEMNLCGHGTIAAMQALHENGQLAGRNSLRIETAAGVLAIGLQQRNAALYITMEQTAPEFVPFTGDVDSLAQSMGICAADVDHSLPIVFGSTRTWTLLVPIRHLGAFPRMQPANAAFPGILAQMPKCSVHPFCQSATSPVRQLHARHFSSPFSGTVEDPVTGTASGVLGAYYATYINPGWQTYRLRIEQGQEMGRDGEVQVNIHRAQARLCVSITGTAVYVAQQIL